MYDDVPPSTINETLQTCSTAVTTGFVEWRWTNREGSIDRERLKYWPNRVGHMYAFLLGKRRFFLVNIIVANDGSAVVKLHPCGRSR